MKYVVSACLAGCPCRYDGCANPCPEVVELCRKGEALPLCPEKLAGLPVPRAPAELCAGRVMTKDGRDLTGPFRRGAERALREALGSGCRKAILKSRSPSCGYGEIYNGRFERLLVPGNGLWAARLLEHGFLIYTEENLPPDPGECGKMPSYSSCKGL